VTKHEPLKHFKPVYAGPLPCVHAPLGGELRRLSSGCYQAIAYIEGVHISLGVYCHASAACAAIVEAHGAD
jgi:hypothetical protein